MTRPVVLVSGATSGIGRTTALAFARQGARLMMGGRDAARGEAVVAACRAEGAEAAFLAGDLAEAGTATALVDAAIACWGRLDIAFNNAGWQEPQGSLVDRDLAVLDRVFAINLRSVAEAMQAQIRVMRRTGGGVIVNDASVSGVRNPYPGFAIYAASKAALLSLTRSLAIEHAPQGIRINAVSPGRIETPMMAGAGVADFATIAASLPARRMGRPEDVAAAVLWLASDAAGFVIGQNLCVDGGFLAG
ncbi:glucose 1-dehydrogenase [Tistrella mobilis]|uniref:SDR family NAD(P)-dependent oxidoreductase n=1 Tax=Tistrella mobilis TaxID=171437 RepID=UPI00355761C6